MTDDHVIRNRAAWNRFAEEFVQPRRKAWADDEPARGTWGVPEAEVGMLSDVEGLVAVELGCGTGYVSAWLARRGARPVGLDNSPVQLATARGFQAEFDLRFPLIHGDAERTPFPRRELRLRHLGVRGRDLVQAVRVDPRGRADPAAGRTARVPRQLLPVRDLFADGRGRTRGRTPASRSLRHAPVRLGGRSVERVPHIPHGEWIRLLRSNGFEVEDLIELQAPEGSRTHYPWVTHEWARRWPNEEVWKARKR